MCRSNMLLVVLLMLVCVQSFRPSMRRSHMAPSSSALNYKVTVINKEKGAEDTYEAGDMEPLLDTAEGAGITTVPYSCRAGSCSACIGMMMEGEVDQTNQIFLDDDKVDQGYILTCVAVPMSDIKVRVGADVETEFYDMVRELGDTL